MFFEKLASLIPRIDVLCENPVECESKSLKSGGNVTEDQRSNVKIIVNKSTTSQISNFNDNNMNKSNYYAKNSFKLRNNRNNRL